MEIKFCVKAVYFRSILGINIWGREGAEAKTATTKSDCPKRTLANARGESEA